jgi:tetratricopeptide (TPR) repeat protein
MGIYAPGRRESKYNPAMRWGAMLVCLLPCLAWAAPSDDDPDEEIAQRHFEIGVDAYDNKRYPEALAEFEAARKAKPSPAFDYNIARAHDRLEHSALAVENYQRYITARPDAADAAEVRTRIELLQQRIAEQQRADATAAAVEQARRDAAARADAAARERARSRQDFIVIGALGGVAVVLAAAGGALVGTVKTDYDRLKPQCPCSPSQLTPLETRADGGYTLIGVAGAVAVVDVVLIVGHVLRHRRSLR